MLDLAVVNHQGTRDLENNRRCGGTIEGRFDYKIRVGRKFQPAYHTRDPKKESKTTGAIVVDRRETMGGGREHVAVRALM